VGKKIFAFKKNTAILNSLRNCGSMVSINPILKQREESDRADLVMGC
jgi:hypothetical protein